MKIAFTDIQAFGDKENERIRFKVTEACNLGDYLLISILFFFVNYLSQKSY